LRHTQRYVNLGLYLSSEKAAKRLQSGAPAPPPADYDGDGRADIAIQRPDSTGAFWILPAATGNYYAVSGFFQFPVPLGYLSPRNWY
jgi:hypothetical protein